VATSASYRWAIRELAGFLDCEPDERAVFERRAAADPEEYAASLLRATGTEWVLVDDGYPPADQALDHLPGAERVLPVLRIERLGDDVQRVVAEVGAARARGYAALKTIAAYRGGLDRLEDRPGGRAMLAALEANAAAPLPVQVHTGFGDSDLALDRSNPALLKPLIERLAGTPFVLLHCYPYVREAGWLAHVYANVYFDLSLTIPHVARPAEQLRQALELAPWSKLLYASDAARTPELYFLAARRWRAALAEVLPELLPPGEAESAARAILRENALSLYSLV
jgi:predicted TIM-barrel fold metal-dependent hydrolase